MKRNKNSFIHFGFSSVIFVLVILCFISFAALSLLTAHTDYKLSKKTADETQNYYNADALAREELAAIDSELFAIYKNASSSEDFYKQILFSDFIKELPQTVSNITIEQTETFPILSYEVPISSEKTLHVSLKIQYPQTESDYFTTIIKWQTIVINA